MRKALIAFRAPGDTSAKLSLSARAAPPPLASRISSPKHVFARKQLPMTHPDPPTHHPNQPLPPNPVLLVPVCCAFANTFANTTHERHHGAGRHVRWRREACGWRGGMFACAASSLCGRSGGAPTTPLSSHGPLNKYDESGVYSRNSRKTKGERQEEEELH